MKEITEYENGTFCWVELVATNLVIAKDFYQQLFGWTYREDSIGKDEHYTMIFKEGKEVGGMYAMRKEQEEVGMPAHWMSYVSVDDLEGTVKKAKELGSFPYIEAMDVGTAGRMACVHEPEGAIFSLWQAKDHLGIKVKGLHGTPSWFELASNDAEKSQTFFKELFGWGTKVDELEEGKSYTLFTGASKAKETKAGLLQMTEEWGAIPAHWMVYYTVESCDEAVTLATNIGGGVMLESTDIPKVGRFSVLQDPQGGIFSVIEWAEGVLP